MLTEGQRQVRDMARQFAARELAPTAAERDRIPRFPREAFARMGELGMLGMTVPAEFDGAGTDYVSYALAIMEIAAADGASSTAFQVHNSLVCLPLLRHGTPQQKERFLRPLARGELLGAFCLTEPGAGSDAAAIAMRAERVGNKFVLNGSQAVHNLRPQRRRRAGLRGDGPGGRQAGHFGVHRADQDSRLHRGAHRAHDGPAFVRPLPRRVRQLRGSARPDAG